MASSEGLYPAAPWFEVGSMAESRSLHTATLLMDGRVLVVWGEAFSYETLATSEMYVSAEIYDPAAD